MTAIETAYPTFCRWCLQNLSVSLYTYQRRNNYPEKSGTTCSEFEKYRIRQDRLYQSDFDKVLLRGTETTLITENETDGIEDENC